MNPTKLLKSTVIPLAAMCLAPLACLAQASPGTTYLVITETPKSDMTAKFEQGVKDVDAYARSHGDTTGSGAFYVVTGPQRGTLVILSPFQWAQQDRPASYEAGLDSVITKNVLPYLASPYGLSFVQVLPNIGNPGPANATPEKYYEVITLRIKPGRMGDFLAAVSQISSAERKENPSSNPVIFYQLLFGGDANGITVAIGHPNLADFAPTGKSMDDVLREAYGGEVTSSIVSALDNSIASEENEIVEYRPDLSFTPGGQGH